MLCTSHPHTNLEHHLQDKPGLRKGNNKDLEDSVFGDDGLVNSYAIIF